jgi:hypothetical protein
MGDDHLTFTVATDDECPEVYLEFYADLTDDYRVWTEDKPFRRTKCLWERIKVACKVIFTGSIRANGAFLFRGEDQIDALTDTIQEHKKYLIERRKTAPWVEKEAGHFTRNDKGEQDDTTD